MHFVSVKLFICKSSFLLFHISVKKISIYKECITGIYTYSLCIYEYILIISTLVYVRNAKKSSKKLIKKKARLGWPLSYKHIFPFLATTWVCWSFNILYSSVLIGRCVLIFSDYCSCGNGQKLSGQLRQKLQEQCIEVDNFPLICTYKET